MSNRFIDDPRFKLFSLSSNEPLAEKIADALGVKLGTINLTQFADGEIKLNVAESIRGSHVYIVQSTSNPV